MTQEFEEGQPKNGLEGFDPLAEGVNFGSNDKSIFEEATQRVVQNILKSYTGYFDIFSEIIQNALDACDKKVKAAGPGYSPRLWVKNIVHVSTAVLLVKLQFFHLRASYNLTRIVKI